MMENISEENATTCCTACKDDKIWQTSDWIFYGFYVLLFVVTIYLFCVISVYAVRNLFMKRNLSRNRAGSSLDVVRREQTKTMRNYKCTMIVLCFVISLCSVLQFVLQQVIVLDPQNMSQSLVLAYKYFCGIQLVIGYMFMWIRQRLFYFASSPLRNLLAGNKFLTAVSNFSIVFTIINVVIQMVLTWYWHITSRGFFYEQITWMVMCFLVQGSLIGLFLYPLFKQWKEQKLYLNGNIGKREYSKSHGNINKLIKRCVFITAVYFITDLVVLFVMIIYTSTYNYALPELWIYLLNDVNSIVNVVCLVGSFKTWKRILAPWYKRKLTSQTSAKKFTTSVISTSV